METKNDVYQMVADKIVEQLEKGVIAWQKPWGMIGGGAIGYMSRKPYSFLNQMLLMKEGEWLTYKQIQECGGKIKKGEKASMVVFYKQYKYEELQEDGTTEEKSIPLLRYYNVWHIDQTEGIESKMTDIEKPKQVERMNEQEELIAEYVKRSGLKFQCDKPSDEAYYSPAMDCVVVPMIGQYEIKEQYYSTVFHELSHSTGAEKRLNRKGVTGRAAFGSEVYSREELVAEMSAAMLCNVTGIDCIKAFKNSVAYIKSWAKHIKNDPKMFVTAAGQAERSAKYIQGIEWEKKEY